MVHRLLGFHLLFSSASRVYTDLYQKQIIFHFVLTKFFGPESLHVIDIKMSILNDMKLKLHSTNMADCAKWNLFDNI